MNIAGNEMFIRSENNTVSEDVLQELKAKAFPAGAVIFPKIGAAIATNKKRILTKRSAFDNNVMGIVPNEKEVSSLFLYYILQKVDLSEWASNAQPPSMRKTVVEAYKLPIPPLEVQEEIVAEIEGYQKIIDGARQVVENYQPRIPIHPDWPMVALEDVSERITDGDHQPPPKSDVGVPFITISNVKPGEGIDFSNTFFVPDEYYEGLKDYRRPRKGDVLYTVTGSFGIPVLIDFESKFCFQRHIGLIRPGSEILSEYLYFYLQSPAAFAQAEASATGVAQKTVSLKSLRAFSVPLPDMETQHSIVAEIAAEQGLVNANKELILRFEEKIKQTINRVWGEEQ